MALNNFPGTHSNFAEGSTILVLWDDCVRLKSVQNSTVLNSTPKQSRTSVLIWGNFVKACFRTTDEQDNETFDASGTLDKLHEWSEEEMMAVEDTTEPLPRLPKRGSSLGGESYQISHKWDLQNFFCQLTRLESAPWKLGKSWEDLNSIDRTETQYYWCINLLEALSRYNTRLEVSHLRPDVPVLEDTHAWWRYAMLASLQQKKLCCWFSWERIKHLCQLRRLYVQMYSTFLKQAPNVDNYAMRKIERSLDSEVVLLWSMSSYFRSVYKNYC
ncbi:hypothetical protein KSP40_PGU004594 [Platanthera guangdongensis]|uniref:Uncharacterized protein n=1 Tax=Platanthera guangdongensis TaxID=2320717 RepID=A0ABR2M774_9ASPA